MVIDMWLFITFIIIAIYFAIGYHEGLKKLVRDCEGGQLKVFGKSYSGHAEIYGDFNFMNEVFSGTKFYSEENNQLISNLKVLRRKLMGQIIFGILAFLSVVIQNLM
jgi:hypothetical protein